MSKRGRGSQPKGRPTPRQSKPGGLAGLHVCSDTVDLTDVEQALVWLLGQPRGVIEQWRRRRDAALRELYQDGPRTDLVDPQADLALGPELASNLAYFTRHTLVALWLDAEADRLLLDGDLVEAAAAQSYRRDWYDLAAAVAVWRTARDERADRQARREARAALRDPRGLRALLEPPP